MSKNRLVNSSRLLLTGVLLLVGCRATATPVQQQPSPKPTASPTATLPSATATLGPARISPAPSPSPTGEQPLLLSSIHMLTSTDGWATDRDGGRILRTMDGGLTWGDVTMRDVSRTPAESTYFANPLEAWATASSVATSSSGLFITTVTVYRTVDGGSTWQAGTPFSLPGGGPGQLKFLNSQYGWLMAGLGAGAGSEAVAILITSDGGDTWERVSLTAGTPGESTPSSLPLICDKTGLAFVNPSVGWATGACPGGHIFFYKSRDGGATWRADTLPAPSGYPADLYSQCQCVVNPPTFFSSQDGFLTVGIYEAQQSWQLYVTRDGGVTWSPHPLPVTQPIGQVDLIDGEHGWVTDGGTLYRTQDGGQTWTEVGLFPTRDIVGSLNFVNTDDGWFIGEKELYVTHNGGQGWAPVMPTLSTAMGPVTTPIVTLADAGQTIRLHVAQRFLLNLGAEMEALP